jgi:CheY-like chemotaxis protein
MCVARTILVADDSPTIQKKASGILTGEGLDVVTVSNGVAAVKKLPTVKPLVVLADISMPGKDGYEVCEFVKKSDDMRHVAVVLVFSDLEPYEAERGARAGADGTIRKPFDHNELISTVQKFLAQAEAAAPQRVAAPPPPKPEPTYVTEPVDEEPVVEERAPTPDLSAFTGGVAFGEPIPSEEVAAVELEPPPPAVFEPAEAPVEAAPPFEFVAPVEAPAEAAEVFAAPEPVEAPAPEEPAPSEPMLVEEEAVPEPQFPPPESTMQFHAPADIAPPVLTEEPEAAPVEAEAPPAPVEAEAPPPLPEPAEPAIAASTLESYTLTEAAEGQVRFGAGPEAPPPVEEEAAPLPEPEAPAAPAPSLDRERVYEIVHKVVAKMSPPAFPAEAIEEMARKFSDEILNELGL